LDGAFDGEYVGILAERINRRAEAHQSSGEAGEIARVGQFVERLARHQPPAECLRSRDECNLERSHGQFNKERTEHSFTFTQLPGEFDRDLGFDPRQARRQSVIDEGGTICGFRDHTGANLVINREFHIVVTRDDRPQYRPELGATPDASPNTLQVRQRLLRVTWQRVPVDSGIGDLWGEDTRSLQNARKLHATGLEFACTRLPAGTHEFTFSQCLAPGPCLLEVTVPGDVGSTRARRLDFGDPDRSLLLNRPHLACRFFFEATYQV
jgi:hypothetical protein